MDIGAMLLYMVTTGITPGPNNLTTLYLSARYGLSGARKFIIGSASVFFLKMLLCGLLNVLLAAVIPQLLPYLKWLGVAYMLYLALKMLVGGFRREEPEQEEKGGEATYAAGILLQTVNMKSWVACLSIFSVYVMPYTTSAAAVAGVSILNSVLMVVWTLLWGSFGSAFRRVYQAHRKLFSVVLAASLVLCAVTAM